MAALESQIDALYQLVPAEFTAARTTLARTLAGEAARQVKQLKKPGVVPWAVNQVYWKAKPAYERVLRSGHALRAAQIAALEGRRSDVRHAVDTHRTAVADAVKQGRKLASAAGLTADPDSMARMFDALSLSVESPGTPGRLTDILRPAGFEALAGVTPIVIAPPAERRALRPEPEQDRAAKDHDEDARAAVRRAEAERKRELQREQQERLSRRRAEHRISAAERTLQRAREAESRAGRAFERAQQDVREAEKALAAARALLP